MKSNYRGARKESRKWAEGMGKDVTDKNVAKRIAKHTDKDMNSFIGAMKQSMKGLK